MKSIHIEDKKTFTSRLFLKEDFDDYYLNEASITTFNTYTVDGRIQKKFYSEEEYRDMGEPEFSRWGDLRKLCFEMIKGSRTPVKFKIVMKLPEDIAENVITSSCSTLTVNDVQGLFINIRFENDSMDVVTATSLKIFSMDKSVEEEFNRYMEKVLALN